jgi:Flp pilus assembly protein protease CpaA
MAAAADWAFVSMVAAAAYLDLRYRRIPNLLTVTGLAVALALRAVEGMEPLTSGLLGAGLAALVTLPLFVAGALGGGDGKLLIAVGGFMGPDRLLGALLLIALIGGIMGLVDALRRKVVFPVLLNTVDLLKRMVTLGRSGHRPELSAPGAITIPYGVAIAIGAALWWFWGSSFS